jgi:hypothetical protein
MRNKQGRKKTQKWNVVQQLRLFSKTILFKLYERQTGMKKDSKTERCSTIETIHENYTLEAL